MTHIYFNSWLERYKRPFGAVQEGTKVDIWISVPEQKQAKVFLIVRKEGSSAGQKIFPMEAVPEDRFHFQTTMDQGWELNFYYFKIIHESEGYETVQYYGFNGNGGEGQIYGAENEVIPYQLTCYQKPETAPNWYRDAIFYQIFPDRFANGNADRKINQPKKIHSFMEQKKIRPITLEMKKMRLCDGTFLAVILKELKRKYPT